MHPYGVPKRRLAWVAVTACAVRNEIGGRLRDPLAHPFEAPPELVIQAEVAWPVYPA